MPVINKDLSVEEAAARVQTKLTIMKLDDLLEGGNSDRRYLLCNVLHAKKCVKSVSYYKINNGQKQKQEMNFNRFVLMGSADTEKVIAIFTYTQQESAELLRFCNYLQPGNTCALIRGKFDQKYMGAVSTTPIIATVEPLVPLTIKTCPPIPCPRTITAPDFCHFIVKTKNLVLNNIDAVGQVCNGIFCDGQPKGDCPCLEVDNRKTSWVVTANLASDNIHFTAKIRSKRLINLFAPNCKNADPNKRSFDVLDFADAVEKCVEHVNSKNGWVIFGWVKPNDVAVETTNYDCDLHIVHIIPQVAADTLSSKRNFFESPNSFEYNFHQ